MSKSLEALKRLKQETCPATYMQDFDKDKCIEIIRKDLEVLEILKHKDINLELLKGCIKLPDGLLRYNKIWAVSDNCLVVYKDKYLKFEEYELLKEWLKDEQV